MLRRLAHVALVVVQAVALEHAAWTTGATWDEPKYVGEGQRMVATGWFPTNPVPSLGFGLAQHVGGERAVPAGPWLAEPVPAALRAHRLHLARQATILVALIGGLATAAIVTGPASLLAHALWALSPTILAHGSLATLDVWVASFSALAAASCRLPGRRGAALAGMFVALAGCSKIVGFGALIYPLLVLRGQRRTLIVATAGATWACHGLAVDWVELPAIGPLPLPAPRLLKTLLRQLPHIYVTGHAAPIETVAPPNDPLYYLRAIVWKVPVTTLALALFRRPDPRLLAWPVVLFVLCSAAQTQMGLKYLLPAAPFVIAWLAGAASPLAWALWAIGALRVLIAPPWLTWNERLLGTRDDALRAVVDGSDWCQDRDALVAWLAANPGDPVYYSGCMGAPDVGLPKELPPCTPTPGVYAIHALDLYRPTSPLPACLAWLPAEPTTHVGQTITIWRVP